MKKAVLALAVLAASSALAQEARPTIGVGIGITPLDARDILPTVEVYMPLSLGPTLRLEPSLGVFTNDQRGPDGRDTRNLTLGVGAFYVARAAAATDLYVGGRLKLNLARAELAAGDESETDWSIAAAVGGEHYLGTRFSIGLEGQLGRYDNGDLSAAVEFGDSGFFTSGVAFLRAYFR